VPRHARWERGRRLSICPAQFRQIRPIPPRGGCVGVVHYAAIRGGGMAVTIPAAESRIPPPGGSALAPLSREGA
jgi:hypothetical protein